MEARCYIVIYMQKKLYWFMGYTWIVFRFFQANGWSWKRGSGVYTWDNCWQVWRGDGTLCYWLVPESGDYFFQLKMWSGAVAPSHYNFLTFWCECDTSGCCILEVYQYFRSWWWSGWSWCFGSCGLFTCH